MNVNYLNITEYDSETLFLTNKNLTSLEGIKNYKNVEKIYNSNNYLSSLKLLNI